jgi:hypothetical protein
MTQVFISYSRKDLAFVECLVEDLKKAGLDIWYDLSGLDGGTRWRTEIQNAIKNSRYVIVVLSPSSVESEWVEREFLFASNLKLKIIPLLYKQCELPMNYLNLNFIDVQGNNYRKNFGEILEALSIEPMAGNVPVNTKGTLISPKLIGMIGVIIVITMCLFGMAIAGYYSLPTIVGLLSSPNPTEAASGLVASLSPTSVENPSNTALHESLTATPTQLAPCGTPGPVTYIKNFHVVSDTPGELHFTVDYNYNGDSGDVLYSAGCLHQGQRLDCVDLVSDHFAPHPVPSCGTLEFRLGIYGSGLVTTDQIFVGIYVWGPSTQAAYKVFDYQKQWGIGLPTPTIVK